MIEDAISNRILFAIQAAGALVTDADALDLVSRLSEVPASRFMDLGIKSTGLPARVFATDPKKLIEIFHIDSRMEGSIAVFDNAECDYTINVRARCLGSDSMLLFLNMAGVISLHDVFLRSSRQTLLWGAGATAVEAFIEVAGNERSVYVGDDCMLSSGIGIRNYDMHTIFSLDDDSIINGEPDDISIEQHVWIGQDALLLSPKTIGYGSIVGAKSFVNAAMPSTSIVAGSPAKVVRTGASWCRSVTGIAPQTKERLARLRSRSSPGR